MMSRAELTTMSRAESPPPGGIRDPKHGPEVIALLKRSPNQLMKLLVGPSRVAITCHKALLGYYSDFFDKACFGLFLEGHSDSMELPEDIPEDITIFVQWCYTGDFETGLRKQYCAPTPEGINMLVRLWILGDKYLAPKFTNDVIPMLCALGGCVQADVAQYVYDNTIPGSKLRQFMRSKIHTEGPFNSVFHQNWGNEVEAPGSDTEDDAENEYDADGRARIEDWKRVLLECPEIAVEQVAFRDPYNYGWGHTKPDLWKETVKNKPVESWRFGELENDPKRKRSRHPVIDSHQDSPPAKRLCSGLENGNADASTSGQSPPS